MGRPAGMPTRVRSQSCEANGQGQARPMISCAAVITRRYRLLRQVDRRGTSKRPLRRLLDRLTAAAAYRPAHPIDAHRDRPIRAPRTRSERRSGREQRPPDAVVGRQLGRHAHSGRSRERSHRRRRAGDPILPDPYQAACYVGSEHRGPRARLLTDNRRRAAWTSVTSIPQGYQHRTRRHWYAGWMRSRLEGEAICQF